MQKYDHRSTTQYINMSDEEMLMNGFNENEILLTKTLPWPLSVEFHLEQSMLHFGASSFALYGHAIKVEFVKDYINKIVAE